MSATLAIRAPRAFAASKYQQAFFDWVANESGSAILKAVAGSGKSTSIVRALPYIPETATVLILAFNSPIAKEMKGKITDLETALIEQGLAHPGRFRGVEASTFHARGYRALLHRWNKGAKVEVDGGKVRKILKDRLSEAEVETYSAFVDKLVGYAKGVGVGIPGMAPDQYSTWEDIIRGQEMWLDDETATEERAIEIARRALRTSNIKAEAEKWIDFNDQLYLPLLWNLRLFRHDWVIVDEAQDTNPVRRELAKRCLKPGGRFVGVGDPKQSIYGFCHPPGELVMTPTGYTPIEKIKKGDAVITSDFAGETLGWGGKRTVIETHKFSHTGMLLTVEAAGRKVTFTPHHRIPIRIDETIPYYTYMMRRCGVYRIGYCQAYTKSGPFMLQHRRRMEMADCAWILGAHQSKADAILAEAILLQRMKGTTFHAMKNEDVKQLPTEEVEALKILAEHGRMADFPLVTNDGKQPRISRRGAFITEACNIIDGMRIAFYSDDQRDTRKRGRSQQKFVWTSATVTAKHYSGSVYGITVPSSPAYRHAGYNSHPVALYFAGGILVHNTGASHDAMELLADEFRTVELPLTVSYRCPKAAVDLVSGIVPYFEVADTAIDGKVEWLKPKAALAKVGHEDAILCRKTAPLVALAFSLIADGRGCRVLGKDIGAGLVSLIKKLRPKGVDSLLERLDAYYEKEQARFLKNGEEAKAEALADRIACIKTVIGAVSEAERTVPKVIDRIDSLFGDGGAPVLTLCTGHKAKGREWPRVLIWQPELLPVKSAKSDEAFQQEMNLDYVMKTRFTQELYLVPAEVRT